ncbi:MAG: TetR/AcrR family transcriptional regulator [Bacteroidetes bacterium]|nr:TetR/AcrR family transcriptional regulator [Bacteroidota bacterium]
MEKDINETTESHILNVAHEVFLKKGLDGTRMQEIADEAGINKSLLHYYYRTKQKLFEKVFKAAFKHFFPIVQANIIADIPLFEKIKIFVETYYTILQKNPYIPAFVIHELNRNSANVTEVFKSIFQENNLEVDLMFDELNRQIQVEVEKGKIISIDARQLIVNILALCIFPFVAKPIIKGILLENNEIKYKAFIEERKSAVSQFIINAISV